MAHQLNCGNPEVNEDSNILDVVIPPQLLNNIPTGMPNIDALCAGDGITPSTVLMLCGLPGSGKTTCGLQLADSVTGKNHVALYNTCEESLYQVRKTVARLNIKNGFIPSYKNTIQELLAHAEAIRAKPKNQGKQFFLFVDSLQTLEYEREEGTRGRPMGQMSAAVEIAYEITAWAKRTYSIAIILSQVTKDGTFVGKQEIKHTIDCLLALQMDTDRRSDTYGKRVAVMEKNRWGAANLFYDYELTQSGLVFP